MEWIDLQLLASVIVTLFVIMDPPGTVPIFIASGGFQVVGPVSSDWPYPSVILIPRA